MIKKVVVRGQVNCNEVLEISLEDCLTPTEAIGILPSSTIIRSGGNLKGYGVWVGDRHSLEYREAIPEIVLDDQQRYVVIFRKKSSCK